MVHFIDFDPPLQKLQCVSLSKTLVSALGKTWCFRPWDISDEGIPSCNICHESNGIDGSSIWVSFCILWRVETRFLESFRDPAYNWFRVLNPKQIDGPRIFEFEKVYLGMGKDINLPIGSRGSFYWFWTPIAKIAMCVIKQNPIFCSRPKMILPPMGNKGKANS